jgi:myosin heavy subunit
MSFNIVYVSIFSGDLYSVIITDLFGFECFYRNGLDQLLANTVNEQLQFLYNQRMFVWEMMEQVYTVNPLASRRL